MHVRPCPQHPLPYPCLYLTEMRAIYLRMGFINNAQIRDPALFVDNIYIERLLNVEFPLLRLCSHYLKVRSECVPLLCWPIAAGKLLDDKPIQIILVRIDSGL